MNARYWAIVVTCAGMLIVGGCSDSDESTTSAAPPATTGSAESESATSSATSTTADVLCGSSKAKQIAANLESAEYSNVKLFDGASNDFTRISVKIPELKGPSTTLVDVYCDEQAAMDAAAELAGEKSTETKVVGIAVYSIIGVKDFDPLTGEPKPLPDLGPLLDQLVADGSGRDQTPSSSSTSATSNADADVEEALRAFTDAAYEHDFATQCKLISEQTVPYAQCVRVKAPIKVPAPGDSIEIGSVDVTGNKARVTYDPGSRCCASVQMVQEGGAWKIRKFR